MKRIYNFIVTKPIACLLIVIVIVFLPAAISAEPQSYIKLIIRSLSIDKKGDEYEVLVIAYIPKAVQSFSENFQTINAKGDSLNNALLNVSKLTGKNLALGQSKLILVNDELCEYGLLSTMDFLVREFSLGNNCVVLNTGKTPAKDVLKFAKGISQSVSISLHDIAEFNEDKLYSRKINLEEVYNASLSPAKTMLLGVITLEDFGLENGQGSGSGSSGSGETSGSSGSSSGGVSGSEFQNKKLANQGNSIVLKEGKKVLDLTSDETFDISWGTKRGYHGLLKLKGVNDNIFTNANINFNISENNVKYKTKFEGSKPVCEITIKPKLMINEINQELDNGNFIESTYYLRDSQLNEAISKEISSKFSKVLKKLIDNKLDVLNIYEIFNANNTKKFKNFLKLLPDQEDYLSEIEFRINVSPNIN